MMSLFEDGSDAQSSIAGREKSAGRDAKLSKRDARGFKDVDEGSQKGCR